MDPMTAYGLGTYGQFQEPEEDDYLAQLAAQYQAILDRPEFVPQVVTPPDLSIDALRSSGLGSALIGAGSGILGAGPGNYMQALSNAGIGFESGLRQGMEDERRNRQAIYQNELDLARQQTEVEGAKQEAADRKLDALSSLQDIAETTSEEERKAKAREAFPALVEAVSDVNPELGLAANKMFSVDEEAAVAMIDDYFSDRTAYREPRAPNRTRVGDMWFVENDDGTTSYEPIPVNILATETDDDEPSVNDRLNMIDYLRETTSSAVLAKYGDAPVPDAKLSMDRQRMMAEMILDDPSLLELEDLLTPSEKRYLNEERKRREGIQPGEVTEEDLVGIEADLNSMRGGATIEPATPTIEQGPEPIPPPERGQELEPPEIVPEEEGGGELIPRLSEALVRSHGWTEDQVAAALAQMQELGMSPAEIQANLTKIVSADAEAFGRGVAEGPDRIAEWLAGMIQQ